MDGTNKNVARRDALRSGPLRVLSRTAALSAAVVTIASLLGPIASATTTFDTDSAVDAPAISTPATIPSGTIPPGGVRVAVLMFTVPESRTPAYTHQEIRDVVFGATNSVSDFYRRTSDGKIPAITGDTLGWFAAQTPMDGGNCPIYTWRSEVDAAAAAAGIDLSQYTNRVYLFPRVPCRSSVTGRVWNGRSGVGWTDSFINGQPTLGTISHELGHNFGLHHAGSYLCTDAAGRRVTLSSTCTSDSYGDPFSIMGNADDLERSIPPKLTPPHTFTAEETFELGFTGGRVVTAPGTYRVERLHGGAAPTLLRIPRGNTEQSFSLDIRRTEAPYDVFWPGATATSGVGIRLRGATGPDGRTLDDIVLLDTVPATETFDDAPLLAGRTFTDPLTGIAIRVESVDDAGATVRVDRAPSNLTATTTGRRVALTWAAPTGASVRSYEVYRDGRKVASLRRRTFGQQLRPGTFTYTVVAVTAEGRRSLPSAPVGVTVGGS